MEVRPVYNIISEMTGVVVAMLEGYCLQYFLGSFLESRIIKSRWNGVLTAVLYGGGKLVLRLVLPSNNESIRIVVKQALIFLILFVLTMCLYKAVHRITLFLIVTYMAVSEISFFLSYMILRIGQHLITLWVISFEQGYIASWETFINILEVTEHGLLTLMSAVFIAILYVSLKKIVQDYREKDYTIRGMELLFILTPGMAGLLICVLLRIIMITVEDEMPKLLYDKYPLLAWIVPAILFLSLLSIIYGVKLFQNMIYLNREKSSRIILEKQIGSMQEHIRETERIYSGIRSMKHDMRNTLSVVMQLAAGNDGKENAELKAYLSELNQTFDRLEYRFKTGNTVVDTLLNMKYHEAMHDIPDLQMDADRLLFPETLLIQSYDIGMILGNALDNAIEACRKLQEKNPEAETFIRISSFQKGKMIFIEVENSFDGNVIRKAHKEFPATDKADKEAHGIGLFNIRSAAEKYHGAVDWSADNKVFTLSVMMQNERRAEG